MSTAAETTFANIVYEKKGAIAYVTLNRPKVMNALSHATWEDLEAAFQDARDDDSVRGVILIPGFVAQTSVCDVVRGSHRLKSMPLTRTLIHDPAVSNRRR